MPHYPKPAEGSWTEHYPELGTEPVSYADSTSPEFYERERAAIFRRTWLNVGRVEQLARKGSYFTRELDAAGTSIVVVRGLDDEVRAFHNICRHRGNKLVWQDYPQEETSGACRQFQCKYHAWRYDLDGNLTFVQQEEEFFGIDKSQYPLASVRCDVWEGWIFVNFDSSDTTSLHEYLGELGKGLEGYPFHELTQVHRYRAEVKSNWKLFIDAFAEFYHAPILHSGQYQPDEAAKVASYGYEALAYGIDGPHGMVSSWGGISPPKDLSMVKPMERKLRSGLFGPWDAPDIGLTEMPPGINPARHKHWGQDSFFFFPNFMILIWKPNWVLTYHYWPTSYNTHIFEGACYFKPPTNARERLAQEYAVVSFKEYGLQDGNTLEATQSMLEANTPVSTFPLNDQEILIRNLHHHVRRYIDEFEASHPAERPQAGYPGEQRGQARRPGGEAAKRQETSVLPSEFADLEPFADWALWGERARYDKRYHSTMTELQAFYDAAFPRVDDALAYLEQFAYDDSMPEPAKRLLWLFCALVTVSFPVEAWRQPRVPDSGAASIDAVDEPAI